MSEGAVFDAVQDYRFPDDFPLSEVFGRGCGICANQPHVMVVHFSFFRGEPKPLKDLIVEDLLNVMAAWDVYEPDLCVEKINERMLAAGHRALVLRDAEPKEKKSG